MDTAQWPQEMVVKPIEEILIPISSSSSSNILSSHSKVDIGNDNSSMEKKLKPPKTQAVNCPRCNSTNTKFCYYNNYSLTQPRYFCKTCRRYWTEGGTLRNIPVGGGTRKHKRTPINSSKKQIPTTNTNNSTTHENPNPKVLDQGQDLNLGCYPISHDFKTISQLIQVPNFENSDKTYLSALELLTGVSSRGCGNSSNSYMPMYSEGFSSLPTLGFTIDGIGNSGYGSVQGVEESGNCGRILFPFEDLKQVSNTNDQNLESNRDQPGDPTGYWNGVLRGGSW